MGDMWIKNRQLKDQKKSLGGLHDTYEHPRRVVVFSNRKY